MEALSEMASRYHGRKEQKEALDVVQTCLTNPTYIHQIVHWIVINPTYIHHCFSLIEITKWFLVLTNLRMLFQYVLKTMYEFFFQIIIIH